MRYMAREDDLNFSHLYNYVEQLADSISGIVSTPPFNQFLLESCQLLANSLDLIHQGWEKSLLSITLRRIITAIG